MPFLSIPLRTPPGYTPNDALVGDLDGDGEYEIVLHQTGRGRDNAQVGITDPPILQAYKLDGTFLWEINLGKNIREGAHYTQFMVYDLDGDGRAEIVCKSADGTADGTGKVIGDPQADYVSKEGNTLGKVLAGPEYLTVFDGRTGAALTTTEYVPPRGDISKWGDLNPGGRSDSNGNRADRFLACVAYLDGLRPSVIMCRGYYGRATLAAWDWRGGKLTQRWVFDSDDGTPGNDKYRGQGNHNLSVADVDGDGKDEIVYGACVIDDNGKGLYSTGRGHGDAMHVSDLDPDRPGLEVFMVHERPSDYSSGDFRDAKTGELLWALKSTGDAGRGLAANIDPRYKGCQCWSAPSDGLYTCKGQKISDHKPRSCNFAVWWDGDLLREILDRNRITKWNWQEGTETPLLSAQGCLANNGSKSTPALSADLIGDWREEVAWRTADGKELRVYTTTMPTPHRLTTLMHDPQYRLAIAWQNTPACRALVRAGYQRLSAGTPLLRESGAGLQLLLFPRSRSRRRKQPAASQSKSKTHNPKSDQRLSAAAATTPCRPRFLLFPQAEDWPESSLEPLRRSRALEELLPLTLLVRGRDLAPQEFHTLARLVETTECYRLHCGEDVSGLPALFDGLLKQRKAARPAGQSLAVKPPEANP